MKPRVVYWNHIPSPYIVERFNAVADRGNLNFEAWFNERREADRSWEIDELSWRFRYRYLPSIGIRNYRLYVPTPLLGRAMPDLLVSLYAEPSFVLGWQCARMRGVRTAFWTEVTYDSWVRRRPWKERLKRYLFRRVDGIVTVGADGRGFARRYGAADSRIFLAPHVIDVEHFAAGRAKALADRERLRRELGLTGATFIYVGRLWWGKGLGHLLDAFAELQRRTDGSVSLLVVGNGLEEAPLRQRCAAQGIRNVVFAGFQQRDVLPSYYAAADVFVFPTLGDPYGLVVDEAMACSLPVISTSAAGEIRDRIEDGVNGFIVPPRNGIALLDRMEALASDEGTRARMGAASLARIQGHTPERWAEDFERAVNFIGGVAMTSGTAPYSTGGEP